MTPMFEELYKEIEHGDEFHRKWLWDKLQDFSKRQELKSEILVEEIYENRKEADEEFRKM